MGAIEALTDTEFLSDEETIELATCYPPMIQSGEHYQLNYNAGSNDEYLQSRAIVCSIGVRYKSYCANIARTLLMTSSDIVQKNYNFIQDVQRELLKNLIPGARLNAVYKSTVEYVRIHRPHLVDHLLDAFGFSMGNEFNDSSLVIGPDCRIFVKESMVFNVSIGLEGLTDAEGNLYALFHSDTAIVNEHGSAMILTPPPYLKLIADCWEIVFDNLSIEDLQALHKTSKYMRQLVSNYLVKSHRKYSVKVAVATLTVHRNDAGEGPSRPSQYEDLPHYERLSLDRWRNSLRKIPDD